MLNHTGTLSHYLASFTIYTLGAVGLIYATYWYIKRKTSSAADSSLPTVTPTDSPIQLMLESSLAIEPHTVLHVVRFGNERFLMSTAQETTQILSRLENVPPPPDATDSEPAPLPLVERPWYAEPPRVLNPMLPPARTRWKERFVQSLRLLAEARKR